MPERPRLQVAIDTLTVEEAVALAATLREVVDLIEAGTPFIKRYRYRRSHPVARSVRIANRG